MLTGGLGGEIQTPEELQGEREAGSRVFSTGVSQMSAPSPALHFGGQAGISHSSPGTLFLKPNFWSCQPHLLSVFPISMNAPN